MTDPDVKSVIADIVQLEYEGNVKAAGFCVILGNGDMRINFAAPEGTKQAIFTASAILQRNILQKFEVVK